MTQQGGTHIRRGGICWIEETRQIVEETSVIVVRAETSGVERQGGNVLWKAKGVQVRSYRIRTAIGGTYLSGRASFLPFEMACGGRVKRRRGWAEGQSSHLLHCRVFPQSLEDVLILRWIGLLTSQVEWTSDLIEERLWIR